MKYKNETMSPAGQGFYIIGVILHYINEYYELMI